jgi:hypothetical protein
MKMKHHKPSGDVDLSSFELGSDCKSDVYFNKISDRIDKAIAQFQIDLIGLMFYTLQEKIMIDVSHSVDVTLKERPNGVDFYIKLDGNGRLIAVVDLPLSENDVRFTAKIDECMEDLSYMDDEEGNIYRSDMANAFRKLADKIDKIAKK